MSIITRIDIDGVAYVPFKSNNDNPCNDCSLREKCPVKLKLLACSVLLDRDECLKAMKE